MKIAVWHNLPSGGGKRALYDHVRGLVQRGHLLKAWCPSTADQSYLPLSELIPERVIDLVWQPRAEKAFPKRSLTLQHDLLTRVKALDEHCYRCAQEINEEGFDILFANSSLYQSVSSIGRYTNIPKVIYLQEPLRELHEASSHLPWMALPRPASPWSLSYLRSFLKDAVIVQNLRVIAREEFANAKAFDVILVNSFFSRESIRRAYGLDAKVCYLGIDANKFSIREGPKEQMVVGLGAFVENKNIELVIEAMARVSKPRLRLLWIGNSSFPPYLEKLRVLANSRGVDFESLVGIDDEELVSLLNKALMMVYGPRLEPFGFAPLEGNACGLPVVAVAEGGIRETVIDGINGLLVECDPDAMAGAIKRLIIDPQEARRLGKTGRKLVEDNWSCEAAVARLERRLKQVHDAVNQAL